MHKVSCRWYTRFLDVAQYGLHVALFRARRACPGYFTDGRLTTIQTAFMGVEDSGWRVVGITRKALDRLATVDFQKHKLPRQLCRGHIVDRIATTRTLFEREEPIPLDAFFETFLQNDTTVVMLKEENTHGKGFPEFIPISNPDANLFPNGALMSWKHRKKEREFLRQLHSELSD
jgi:hypothetical protein